MTFWPIDTFTKYLVKYLSYIRQLVFNAEYRYERISFYEHSVRMHEIIVNAATKRICKVIYPRLFSQRLTSFKSSDIYKILRRYYRTTCIWLMRISHIVDIGIVAKEVHLDWCIIIIIIIYVNNYIRSHTYLIWDRYYSSYYYSLSSFSLPTHFPQIWKEYHLISRGTYRAFKTTAWYYDDHPSSSN